jgi:ABC-type branched-subunit amino acid transport system substrate-binding protein
MTPRRTAVTTLTAASLAVLLAACGSQLEPSAVAKANAGLQGTVGVPQAGGAPGPAAGTTGGTGGGATGAVGTTGGSSTGTTGGQAGTTGAAGNTGSSGGGTGTQAASCSGLTSQTGVTKDKIVIANVSDISGPVPGLFQSSQDAVRAYVAYFNATSSICGHKLELLPLDSRTDSGADQEAYLTACQKAFAAVGSMAGFDGGGAPVAQGCKLPDLRAASVSAERQRCTTCFGTDALSTSTFQNAVPDHVIKDYPAAAKAAAMLYINAATAPANANAQANAMERRGMHFVYRQGIDISDFNYAPYVQQLKNKGARYVQFLGPHQNGLRLAQAMQQQGFKPDFFAYDPTAYDPGYVSSGGSAAEGTHVFLNTAMFEEASTNKEMQLYQSWLQQVHPGAAPTFFGVFSWSAARLFVEQAQRLGAGLTRASLVNALTKVDGWTANGLHAPQHVGPKKTGECWRWIVLRHGLWVPDGPRTYTCHGVTSSAAP